MCLNHYGNGLRFDLSCHLIYHVTYDSSSHNSISSLGILSAALGMHERGPGECGTKITFYVILCNVI